MKPFSVRCLIGILLVLALPVSFMACSGRQQAPNVLLITVDTLRPDALGFVNGRADTPAIDGLAAGGRAFDGALSPVPLTLPAHASMLSGRLPRSHGVRDNGQTVPADVPMLQEILRERGWRTGAFVSGFPLQAMFGLDRGFDHYDDTMGEGAEGWVERRAKETVAAASGWIESLDKASPWFGWVHFYDPHDPYDPPREFWQPGPRGAYDGEVAYTDYWIGKLLETARAAGGSRPLLVILTADHGEALGEHGEVTHGFFVYDSTMRIPLIFEWPGRIVPGHGTEALQLVDIAPTVLDLLDLPVLASIDGRSQRAGLEGGEFDVHPAFLETWLPWTYYGWAPLSAWREDEWKFIDAPSPELYHLLRDAHESTNLADREVAVADRLALALDAARSADTRVASTHVDDAAIQRLRSLGYVGVGAPVEAPPAGLPDPKSRIAMRERLQEAEVLLRRHAYAAAQEIFDGVLAEEPDNRFATLRSGIALLRLNRASEAVDVLTRSVAVEPRRAEARYALADALMRTADYHAAAEQWAALAELQPRRPEAWFNLATALAQAGEQERSQAAMSEYEKLRAAAAREQGTTQ